MKNWLRNPKVQEVIRQSKRSTDVRIGREFVEEMSLEKNVESSPNFAVKPASSYSSVKIFDTAEVCAVKHQQLGQRLCECLLKTSGRWYIRQRHDSSIGSVGEARMFFAPEYPVEGG
jgi:hypothetical protein